MRLDSGELLRCMEEAARRKLGNFARFIVEGLHMESFHKAYYGILDGFAHGRIRKLIVQMPPQQLYLRQRQKSYCVKMILIQQHGFLK